MAGAHAVAYLLSTAASQRGCCRLHRVGSTPARHWAAARFRIPGHHGPIPGDLHRREMRLAPPACCMTQPTPGRNAGDWPPPRTASSRRRDLPSHPPRALSQPPVLGAGAAANTARPAAAAEMGRHSGGQRRRRARVPLESPGPGLTI